MFPNKHLIHYFLYYFGRQQMQENFKENLIYNALYLFYAFEIYYQATKTRMQAQKDPLTSTHPNNNALQPTDTSLNSSNVYELHLISQYLAFNSQSSLEASKIPVDKDPISTRQNETPKNPEMDQDPKIKSAFHNFQKHLINTLKKSIKLKKIQCIEKSRLRIAYELWQYFTSSTKSTKKLLYTILGDDLINSSQFKKAPNQQNIELCELLKKTDEEEVKTSQTYLRTAILKQSRILLKGKLLKGRRMHRSSDFKSYFENFVEELEEGTLMRRIPKERKKNILQNTSTSQSV